ncbi:hypothetical protein C8R45DRAFT_481056 [Mycena sanguinolenta]|nr:hypothetical protein C8R45DRAFT_481056 [Mycena sanguinolenta]
MSCIDPMLLILSHEIHKSSLNSSATANVSACPRPYNSDTELHASTGLCYATDAFGEVPSPLDFGPTPTSLFHDPSSTFVVDQHYRTENCFAPHPSALGDVHYVSSINASLASRSGQIAVKQSTQYAQMIRSSFEVADDDMKGMVYPNLPRPLWRSGLSSAFAAPVATQLSPVPLDQPEPKQTRKRKGSEAQDESGAKRQRRPEAVDRLGLPHSECLEEVPAEPSPTRTLSKVRVKSARKKRDPTFGVSRKANPAKASNTPRYPCPKPDCSKDFGRAVDRRRHELFVHDKGLLSESDEDLSPECPYCGKKLSRFNSVIRHERKHCPNSPYAINRRT